MKNIHIQKLAIIAVACAISNCSIAFAQKSALDPTELKPSHAHPIIPAKAVHVPPPALKTIGLLGVHFEPSTVIPNQWTKMVLSFNRPLPPGGATVHLTSPANGEFALPKKVKVPAGSVTFAIWVKPKHLAPGHQIEVGAAEQLESGQTIDRKGHLNVRPK